MSGHFSPLSSIAPPLHTHTNVKSSSRLRYLALPPSRVVFRGRARTVTLSETEIFFFFVSLFFTIINSIFLSKVRQLYRVNQRQTLVMLHRMFHNSVFQIMQSFFFYFFNSFLLIVKSRQTLFHSIPRCFHKKCHPTFGHV